MKIIDPGHVYELTSLDGGSPEILRFVKREGERYPGNVGHHPGTTTQEVLRALLDRSDYVNAQLSCPENEIIRGLLRSAIWLLESRAAARHGRRPISSVQIAVDGLPCITCGHISCGGQCREVS